MDLPKNRSEICNTMLGKTSARRNLGYRDPEKSLGQVHVSAKPVRLGLKAAENRPRAAEGPTRHEEVSVERVPVQGVRDALRPRSANTGSIAGIASNMIRGLCALCEVDIRYRGGEGG
jgi:hypothetical protein